MVENILQDFDRAYGMRFSCLRYFNAAGGDPENEVKNYKTTNHNLIPVALRSLKFGDGEVTIYGTDYPTADGTCIRDYVHVYDIGTAHLAAMEYLFRGNDSCCFNLGIGAGFSVRQVLDTIEKVTKKKLHVHEGVRRAGDPPALVAEGLKARKILGWQPRYLDLGTMIDHAWEALHY